MNVKFVNSGKKAITLLKHPPSLAILFLLVILLELEESVQRAPTIRILEDAICRKHYRSEGHIQPIEEHMCKISAVQERLAHVRGLLSFFDGLPVLLFGAAFGSIADSRGRRLVFACAVFGTLCALGFIYTVCHFWEYVPIEVVWCASVFRLLGGGPILAIAMCLTMASDLSTEDTRSITFYRVYSAVLIVDLIGPPITYATLKHSLWLPYLVCALALLLTYPVLARMPETLQRSEPSENRPIFSKSNIMDYKKFFQSWNIMIGVATVFLAQFRVNTIEILLPYTSVRFGLELGEAATLLSIVSAVNITVFLLFLPALTALLRKAGWSVTVINLYVARTSSALLAVGAAGIAAASNLVLVILALIIYAAGFGVRLSILAVLTILVNSAKDTGRLYSLVALTDSVAHMIASPLLQSVWSRALNMGGGWLVLPFIVLMCVFLLAFAASCLLRPSSMPIVRTESGSEEEQESFLHGVEDEAVPPAPQLVE